MWGLKFNYAQQGSGPVKYPALSSSLDKEESFLAQREPAPIPLCN